MKCAYIEWIDSCHMDSWHHSDSLEGAKSEHSVGLLVKDEQEFITIALSWAPLSSEYGHLIAIPKVAIRKLEIFEKPAKGSKKRAPKAPKPIKAAE